jgi:hypothetical protein
LSTHPAQFEGLILQNCKPGGWVVCDEIQRVPGLLNYVHKLIEEKNIKNIGVFEINFKRKFFHGFFCSKTRYNKDTNACP